MNDSPSEILLEPSIPEQKDLNWFQRTFSKMGKDSLRGSIFIMLLTALGTGIFTLHHMFDRMGIVFAIALIVVIGICFFITSNILTHALKSVPRCCSMSDLNNKVLGRPAFVIYNILLFVYIMLCLIASISSMSKIIYLNFEALIWKIFPVDKENQNLDFFNQKFAFVLGFLLFFLIVQREIESLRYFTLYSFFIFVFVVVVFIVQSPLYINNLNDKNEAEYNYVDFTPYGLFTSFGCCLFAYNAIVNFYTVVGTVQNPTTKRLNKIFFRTFAILGSLFIVVGLVAYLCFGKKYVDGIDLFIFRDKIGDSDIIMVLGRSLLILSLATGAGMNAYPLKVMLRQAFNFDNSVKVSVIMSIAILATCTIVVSLFNVVTKFVSFAGAFCATLMAFTYPCLIGLKTNYAQTKLSKFFLYVFMIVLTSLGMASSYISFMEFFKK